MNNLKRYLLYEKVNFTCRINTFISLFQHIPGINKLFNERIYRQYRFKNWLSLLGAVFDMFYVALTSILETYILICIIPEYVLGKQLNLAEMALIFIGAECIAKSFGSCPLFRSNRIDYMFLNHFMVDPAEYYRFKALRSALFTCVPLIALFGFVLQDWMLALVFGLLKSVFCLAANVFYLLYFDKKQKIPNVVYRRVIPFIITVSCILLIVFAEIPEISVALSLKLGLIALLSAAIILLWGCHRRFQHYHHVALHFRGTNMLVMSVSVNSVAAESSNTYLQSLKWEDNKRFYDDNHNLPIQDYMTKAFYKRLGRGIKRQQLFNMAAVMIIYVVLGLLLNAQKLTMNIQDINSYSTLLIPISLLFSQAGKLTQMFFYNIDIHMLKLNAYPGCVLKKTALRRFRDNILLDIFSSLYHFVCMLLCVWISGYPIPFRTIVIFGLTSLCILCIQDIYEYLIYFYVQPYSNDMSVQSPIIRIIGLFGSLVGLCCIVIRRDILSALPVLLIITALLCVVFCAFSGCIIRTFKLKR